MHSVSELGKLLIISPHLDDAVFSCGEALACKGEATVATPVAFDTHGQAELKRRAVQCYASQLQALATQGRPGHSDIHAPEGFWQLSSDNPSI